MTPNCALRMKNGKLSLVIGHSCSELECRETGCSFPFCAKLKDTEHTDFIKLQEEYPSVLREYDGY